ncbi:hypothetical protein EYC84_005098 [Monilinia fructicola]|uniref:FAD/NAD(P)-binding domain-containing protein n=1 Tax=Monilinia fructicola TaxID=38448 RepID=A0A5M9JYE9_MONFR|nr:hypothetical protein EYC84_005098 [Monilinia fructicola]
MSSNSNSNSHKVVILGGNFGGVNAVHHLLRQTLPQLHQLDQSKSYHVTLVTPNTSFFFKIASPRALINSTLIPHEKVFRPLSEAFSKYDSSQFELLQGVASALDPAQQRTVTVSIDGDTGTTQQLHYDSLIISTGTTSKSPLWTLHNDQSLTEKALNSLHRRTSKCQDCPNFWRRSSWSRDCRRDSLELPKQQSNTTIWCEQTSFQS